MKNNKIYNIIFQFIFENIVLNDDIDFKNKNNVISWLNKNAPDALFDVDGNLDWNYTDVMTGDPLDDLIDTYIDKYKSVSNLPIAQIYRMVLLNTIDDLDLNNVGVFWSFDENGAGFYDIKKTGDYLFILTATVNTNDIDWKQGFFSFLLYGKTEFDCYMKKGAPCIITHINGEKLSKPLNGFC